MKRIEDQARFRLRRQEQEERALDQCNPADQGDEDQQSAARRDVVVVYHPNPEITLSNARTKSIGALCGTSQTLIRGAPVFAHELPSPLRVANFASGGEFRHIRFDVQNRRAVDGVKPGDFESQILDRQQAADGNADPIRTVLAALREDTDLGPVRPIAGMPRAGYNFGFLHQMKEENDFDMREAGESRERIRGESRRVEIDAAGDAAPNVVDGVYDGAVDDADGVHGWYCSGYADP